MLRLEHIGIAVQHAEQAAAMFQKILGADVYKTQTVDRERVRTHFIATDSAKLELLEATSPESVVARFLEKNGEGLHHLSFEVENVYSAMRHVIAAGYKPLNDEPRKGADGKLIFFLHPKQTHGILIEICQSVLDPPDPIHIPITGTDLLVRDYGTSENPALITLLMEDEMTLKKWGSLFRLLDLHYRILTISFHRSDEYRKPAYHPISRDTILEGITTARRSFELETSFLLGISPFSNTVLHVSLFNPDLIRKIILLRFLSSDLTEMEPDLPQQALQRLHIPTLLCAVDDSEGVSLENTLSLHDSLPQSTLAVLPATGQPKSQVDFDILARLIRQYLQYIQV